MELIYVILRCDTDSDITTVHGACKAKEAAEGKVMILNKQEEENLKLFNEWIDKDVCGMSEEEYEKHIECQPDSLGDNRYFYKEVVLED